MVTVQVGTQVSGTISKLFVDFNSPVKKGQPIAQIDPSLFLSQVEQSPRQRPERRGEPGKGAR